MLGRFKKIQNFIRLNKIEPAEAEVIKAITLYSTTKEREVLEKADELLDKLIKEREAEGFTPISTKEVTTQKEAKSALDYQVGGNHYQKMVYQPLTFIMEQKLEFCEGNIIKYIARYKNKNGLQDLKKAQHYLKYLIEFPG